VAVSGSPKLFVSMPYGLRMVAAHFVSVGAASVFMFLFFVALQGLLICSLPYRLFKRVSLYIQVISIVALLLMFPLMSLAPSLLPSWMSTNSRALVLVPPMWFLGLYRTLIGSNEEVFRHLALISAYRLAAVALVSAATYLISYKLYVQKAAEALARGNRETGSIRRFDDVARSPYRAQAARARHVLLHRLDDIWKRTARPRRLRVDRVPA
jgi:hypothetical protein